MIPIPIPIGRSYSATATGAVWKPVCCEHCGCEFAYQLVVSVQGRGFSPLFLSNYEAQESARQRAVHNLENRLARATGLAPCPDCGKYQSGMVSEMKRTRLSRVLGTLLGLAVWLFLVPVFSAYKGGALILFLIVMVSLLVIARVRLGIAGMMLVALIGYPLAGLVIEDVLGPGSTRIVGLIMSLILVGYWVRIWRFYDPNANREQEALSPQKQARSKNLTIRRAEFEKLATELKSATGRDIADTIRWPSNFSAV